MVASTDAFGCRDTERPTEVAPFSVVATSAFAIVVSTLMVSVVALFNLDDVSPQALAHDAFRLGASAMFLAACILAVSRLRLGGDDGRATATAGVYGVLALLALPTENLTGQLSGPVVRGWTGLVSHVGLTLACLFLAQRAVRGADDPGASRRTGSRPTTDTAAVAALTALAGLLVTVVLSAQLTTVGPLRLRNVAFVDVAVEIILAGLWFALAVRAGSRDRLLPWARRIGPLLGSLGVVEVLRALEHLQPGVWGLSAAALLASVAMVTTHNSFVDLLDAVRRRVRRVAEPRPPQTDVVRTAPERLSEVDVDEVVARVVAHRRDSGQEIQLRGGRGVARTNATDLAMVLSALTTNAARHAPESPVTIQVVSIADRVEISVSDRGPGLSARQADALFVDDGSGHGLPAVRDLVRRCGGEVALTRRIGGATFVVTLPAARVAPVIALHATA